jgi:hypothetical protein
MINCTTLHHLCKKQGGALSRYGCKAFRGLHHAHPNLLIINRNIYMHTHTHTHTHTYSNLQSVKSRVVQLVQMMQ